MKLKNFYTENTYDLSCSHGTESFTKRPFSRHGEEFKERRGHPVLYYKTARALLFYFFSGWPRKA
jgi:hypothetical protein